MEYNTVDDVRNASRFDLINRTAFLKNLPYDAKKNLIRRREISRIAGEMDRRRFLGITH